MSLLNKTKAKQLALHVAQTTRPAANFTRVSKGFLEDLEASVHTLIRQKVHANPSVGTTLR